MNKSIKTIFLLSIIFLVGLNGKTQNITDNYFEFYDYQVDRFQQIADEKGIELEEVKGWKEFIKWNNYYQNRHATNGDLLDYAVALEEYFSNNEDVYAEEALDWEYIGFDDIIPMSNGMYDNTTGQGYIASIWVDKNNLDYILAGGHTASLWRTFDGGDNWENISKSEPLIKGVASIEVSPNDNDRIYIASTPDPSSPSGYSMGLFTSYLDNGEIKWNRNRVFVPTLGTSGKYLYPSSGPWNKPVKWIVNPTNENIMFLITWGKILRSIDGGDNWDILYNLDEHYPDYPYWDSYTSRGFKDIEFDPDSEDYSTLYISGFRVFKITNNGDTQEDFHDITSEVTQFLDVQSDDRIKVLTATKPGSNKIWFAVHSDFYYIDDDNPNNNIFDDNIVVMQNDNISLVKMIGYEYHARRMMCEVSPINEGHILLGGLGSEGLVFAGVQPFMYQAEGPYIFTISKTTIPENWTHVDPRAACFLVNPDDDGKETIFFGNDGSVFKSVFTSINEKWDWTYLGNDGENGIRNTESWGFDCTNSMEDVIVTGLQDMMPAIKTGDIWMHLYMLPETSTIRIDRNDPTKIYYKDVMTPSYYKSFTGGPEYGHELFYKGQKSTPVNAPITINPGNNKEILIGDMGKLLKFPDIYNNNEYEVLLSIMDDPTLKGPHFTGIEFCKSKPQNILAYTNKQSPHPKCFYRSTDGGVSWDNLTQNLSNGLDYATISCATFNPYDENEIWVGFGSIATNSDPQLAKKVYVSYDGGVTWTAKANGLPEGIPVNDIEFDERTGDKYLVNDVGIYFLKNVDGVDIWENITDNAPVSMVNGIIRFNYIKNKIRVSTFGRGMWEAELPCTASSNPETISTNTTWNTGHYPTGDLIVEAGVTLTVTNFVHMLPEASIIIKPTGKLILDGGTLTNACIDLWNGVEVRGNSYSANSNDQGKLIMKNNAVIENAIVGVKNCLADEMMKYGGIVEARNSSFLNNETGVYYKDYKFDNKSFFINCNFEVNGNYIGDNNIVTQAVKMQRIEGPVFNNCHFSFSKPKPAGGNGIYAYSASFVVNGENTSFDNFRYAIEIHGSGHLSPCTIMESTFNRNDKGIFVAAGYGHKITDNIFNIPASYGFDVYGILLEYSDGYIIEDNYFNCKDADIAGTVGLYINNSGTNENRVYRNTFDFLDYATIAYGINGDETNKTGVYYKCNTFNENNWDISVVTENDKGLIKTEHGSDDATDPEAPASNYFSHNYKNPPNFTDFNNLGTHINYYYPLITDSRYRPDKSYGLTKIQNKYLDWTHDKGCPPSTTGGGDIGTETRSSLRNSMVQNESQADSIQNILNLLVDGGNTEQTKLDVETSFPPETYTVYTELMGKSPYLSKEVVDASIEKEEVLPNVMIRDIIVANPQSAKDKEAMEKIEERAEPMPDYMKAQILLAREIVGYMETLEAKKARCYEKRAANLRSLTQNYLMDSLLTDEAKLDSLIVVFENENNLSSSYLTAMLYSQKADYGTCESILSDIPSTFNLSTEENTAYNDFMDYYQIFKDYNISGELTDTQVSELEYLYQQGSGLANVYARNLLIAEQYLDYTEAVVLPGSGLYSAGPTPEEELQKALDEHHYLTIAPNPAKDYFLLSYQLEMEYSDANIQLIDNRGVVLKTIAAKETQNQVVVSTADIKAGVYILRLSFNGKIRESKKINIIK